MSQSEFQKMGGYQLGVKFEAIILDRIKDVVSQLQRDLDPLTEHEQLTMFQALELSFAINLQGKPDLFSINPLGLNVDPDLKITKDYEAYLQSIIKVIDKRARSFNGLNPNESFKKAEFHLLWNKVIDTDLTEHNVKIKPAFRESRTKK